MLIVRDILTSYLGRLPSEHAWAPDIHLKQVRLLGDMHRGPAWACTHNIPQRWQFPGAHLHPYIICKRSTSFYFHKKYSSTSFIPIAPVLLPSPPESCISHVSIILSAAKSLLLTGNLRQTHYGHKSIEHRALV